MRQFTLADLCGWLDSEPARLGKREWFEFPGFHLKAYLRHTRRYFVPKIRPSLDIASFEVEEEWRGQGNFSLWFESMLKITDQRNLFVFVESVLNDNLNHSLLENGFQLVEGSVPPCYIRKSPDER